MLGATLWRTHLDTSSFKVIHKLISSSSSSSFINIIAVIISIIIDIIIIIIICSKINIVERSVGGSSVGTFRSRLLADVQY